MRTVCHYQSELERNLIQTAHSASLTLLKGKKKCLKKKEAREMLIQRS